MTVVASVVPGLLILRLLPDGGALKTDEVSAWPVAFGLTYGLIGVLVLTGHALFGDATVFSWCGYGVATVALAWWTQHKRCRWPRLDSKIVAAFGLYCVYMLVLLVWLPSYKVGLSADYNLYYPNVSLFLGQTPIAEFDSFLEKEYLIRRTPFVSLFGAFFLGLFGPTFQTFQVVCLAANAMVFWIVLMVSEAIGGRRARWWAVALLLISPAITRGVSVPEPKVLGAVFVVLALVFYTRHRAGDSDALSRVDGALAAVFAVTATMTHPSMIFFVLGIYVHQLFRRLRRKERVSGSLWLASVITSLVLAGPWFLYLVDQLGVEAALRPSTTMVDADPMEMGALVATRLLMVVTTILGPPFLLDIYMDVVHYLSWSAEDIQGFIYKWGKHLNRFHQQSFLGALGLPVGIVMLSCLVKFRGKLGKIHPFGVAALCLFSGSVLVFAVHLAFTDYMGHAMNLTAPVVLVFLCVAGSVMSAQSRRMQWVIGVTSAVIFLMLRGVGFYIGLFQPDDGLGSIGRSAASLHTPAGAVLSVAILVVVAVLILRLVGREEDGDPARDDADAGPAELTGDGCVDDGGGLQ